MGRDKRDAISNATGTDIRNVLALAEEDWGLRIELETHFNPVLNKMIMSARCGFTMDNGDEYLIYEDGVWKDKDLPYATAMYRIAIIVWHRVDQVLAGNPSRKDCPL